MIAASGQKQPKLPASAVADKVQISVTASPLAFRDGPGAAAWANLMRSNDAGLMLATCTGLAVKTIEGRRACNVPLWLDPPSMVTPAVR